MKGIGTNLSNYRAVYLQLYSYFERVPYLAKGDLSDLVVKMYRKFSITPKRFLNQSVVKREILDFSCLLKFSKGTLTYDTARLWLCRMFGDASDFNVPNESNLHDFMKKLLSHGLAGQVQEANRKILQLGDNLIKGFPTEDLPLVGSSPLAHGIINHVKASLKTLQEYVEGDGRDIFDVAARLNFIDPVAIFNRKNKIDAVMGTIIKKSVKSFLPKDGVIYYGSSMGSSSHDTSYLLTSSI